MNYDQELSTPDRTWELLNKYSVEACSQAAGFAPKSTHKYTTDGRFKNMAHTLLDSESKVACVHLEKMKSGQIRVGGTGTGGTLCLSASLLDDHPTWVPAYFLPWDDKGGAVEITIPEKTGAADKAHPRLFFTTCLSGCSVIFKGTPRKPTILHCGINADLPSGEDANTYWKDFVNYIDEQRALDGGRYGRSVKAQATKSQYVSGIEDPTAPKYGSVKPKTTQHTLDMTTQLKKHYEAAYPSSPVEIMTVMPWGAVFGLRRGDDWQFYLQENVNIIYVRRVMDSAGKEVKQMMNVARPMVVTPIFPAGGGVAGVKHNWRSLLLTKSGDMSVAPPSRHAGLLDRAVTT